MQKSDMDIDFAAVEEIVRQAGTKLVPKFGNISHTFKTAAMWDAVTKLDIETETFLDKQLEKLEPNIGFVGEEHGVSRKREKFWLVDPIDGTAHFIRGLPFCTTMIALVDSGEVVFGAIYDFLNQDYYSAIKGRGAYQNGQAIAVSTRNLSNGFINAEINAYTNNNEALYKSLATSTHIMDTYNCGWSYSMIASGKIEGRVVKDGWGKDWDYAPGSLLVQEAGGLVSNLGKSTYDYTNHDFIASNEVVHSELTTGADAIFPVHTQ